MQQERKQIFEAMQRKREEKRKLDVSEKQPADSDPTKIRVSNGNGNGLNFRDARSRSHNTDAVPYSARRGNGDGQGTYQFDKKLLRMPTLNSPPSTDHRGTSKNNPPPSINTHPPNQQWQSQRRGNNPQFLLPLQMNDPAVATSGLRPSDNSSNRNECSGSNVMNLQGTDGRATNGNPPIALNTGPRYGFSKQGEEKRADSSCANCPQAFGLAPEEDEGLSSAKEEKKYLAPAFRAQTMQMGLGTNSSGCKT